VTAPQGDWSPFDSEVQFSLADLLYRRAELSTTNIDTLLELWASSLDGFNATSPFRSHQEMHSIIDSSILGDVPWQCMVTGVPEDIDEHAPSWMQTNYEVWYRDPDTVVSMMLDNPDFEGQFDLCPYVDIGADGKRRWNNLMSGNIAWRCCVSHWHLQDACVLIMLFQNEIINSNPRALGAMYCPIILGSDKTTVSVATGHVEYHPLYLSIGNPHNTVRRAHRNAVVPIAFLAIPKSA